METIATKAADSCTVQAVVGVVWVGCDGEGILSGLWPSIFLVGLLAAGEPDIEVDYAGNEERQLIDILCKHVCVCIYVCVCVEQAVQP